MHKFSDDAKFTLEVGGAKMEAKYNASKDEWTIQTTLPSGRFRGGRVWNQGIADAIQVSANEFGGEVFTALDCFPEFSCGGNERDEERIRTLCRIFGTQYIYPATEQPETVPLLIMDGDKFIKRMENYEEAVKFAKTHGFQVFQEQEVEGGG